MAFAASGCAGLDLYLQGEITPSKGGGAPPPYHFLIMSSGFKATPHPVLPVPTGAKALELGRVKLEALLRRREELIAQEKHDLFTHGYIAPIWRLIWAIMGVPWVDQEWARRVRLKLGFNSPRPVTLINGGNRSGKSKGAARTVMTVLRREEEARAWGLHSTNRMSIDYQQPYLEELLAPELRGQKIQTATTYIAFKSQTGFSAASGVGKFTLPNRSDMSFLNYEMDRTTIEGGNLRIVWPDELVPPDWVATMEFRIAEKNGFMPITFTPVNGYTPTVAMFQDGAEVVLESIAYLLPRDGGAPDVARALGLSEEELAEWRAAHQAGRASWSPACRPEDFEAWLEGKPSQPAIPEGRDFERVPRVLKCADQHGKRAVVFIYSSDNPYGNPLGVWEMLAGKPPEWIKERFYGIANKLASTRFRKYSDKVGIHLVAPEAIPNVGTDYLYCDPASARNFYMLWIRVTPEQIYAVEEWPGCDVIPGVGLMGPWAVPDPRKLDGKMGPAQDSLGWGNIDYKKLMAHVEGWKDAERVKPDGMTEAEWLKHWDAGNGSTKFQVLTRKIDARFASSPMQENDRPKTLITEFEEIGVYFEPWPLAPETDKVQAIIDALAYDESQEISFHNKPRLLISTRCQNLRYSLRAWTGADGQKGACKDPIDTLGAALMDETDYVGEGDYQSTGGGYYR